MTDFTYSLSIVVPVYKSERFIKRCVCSLFEQILQDIEFIFIDDYSLDRSIDILEGLLEKYPQRKLHVRILRNNENKGVAAVRNIGLREAKGMYIGWVDSDDWVESAMYSDLYKTAIENASDIVWCDYYNSYPDHEDRQFQGCKSNNIDYIKALLLGKLHGGVCFTIIKKTLFTDNSIFFPDGKNVMEDKNVLIKLACFAQRISYMPIPYYHYIKYNDNSITSNWITDPDIERVARLNLENIFSFLKSTSLGYDFTKDICYAKLIFKKGYLNQLDIRFFEHWRELYEEANFCVLRCPNTTFKQRILGWCISRDYYFALKFWIKLKRI